MILKTVLFRFSYTYCPMISRIPPQYCPLQYHEYYINKAKSLKVARINYKQVTQDSLIKLLRQQITEDRMIFQKQKQILVVGRSNVGKSSLINSIFNQKLARASKHTGTTKYMHFYGLHNYNGTIIDTPGYGYSNMNLRRRGMWFGSTYQYLKVSSRVSQIIMCVNAEHGLKKNDVEFLKRANTMNLSIQIVLTKSDKVKEEQLYYKMIAISKEIDAFEFKNISNKIIAVSNKTRFGIEYLRYFLVEALENSQQRNIDNNQDLLLQYLKENKVQPVDIKATAQKTLTKPYLVRKLIYNSKLTKHLI